VAVRVWLMAQKLKVIGYIRPNDPTMLKGRWIGPDTTQQENGTMTQQAVEDWALSTTDYEALFTPQAHEPEPQATNGHMLLKRTQSPKTRW
jgi:hypothetical protein